LLIKRHPEPISSRFTLMHFTLHPFFGPGIFIRLHTFCLSGPRKRWTERPMANGTPNNSQSDSSGDTNHMYFSNVIASRIHEEKLYEKTLSQIATNISNSHGLEPKGSSSLQSDSHESSSSKEDTKSSRSEEDDGEDKAFYKRRNEPNFSTPLAPDTFGNLAEFFWRYLAHVRS
jgi:hypothetical protein